MSEHKYKPDPAGHNCPACNKSGNAIPDDECEVCRGAGFVREVEEGEEGWESAVCAQCGTKYQITPPDECCHQCAHL